MGIFENGAEWLGDMLHDHAAREIVYRRGTDEIETKGLVGVSHLDSDTGDGAVTRFEVTDYLVRASELSIDDVPLLPEPGDQIDDVLLGKTFEVFSPRQNDCFSFVDNSEITLRIHVQLVT